MLPRVLAVSNNDDDDDDDGVVTWLVVHFSRIPHVVTKKRLQSKVHLVGIKTSIHLVRDSACGSFCTSSARGPALTSYGVFHPVSRATE